jgi:hypothetical protein
MAGHKVEAHLVGRGSTGSNPTSAMSVDATSFAPSSSPQPDLKAQIEANREISTSRKYWRARQDLHPFTLTGSVKKAA